MSEKIMFTYTYMDGTQVTADSNQEVLAILAGTWLEDDVITHYTQTLLPFDIHVTPDCSCDDIVEMMLSEGLLSK